MRGRTRRNGGGGVPLTGHPSYSASLETTVPGLSLDSQVREPLWASSVRGGGRRKSRRRNSRRNKSRRGGFYPSVMGPFLQNAQAFAVPASLFVAARMFHNRKTRRTRKARR